jgi:Cu/Zn superoxide dismutase
MTQNLTLTAMATGTVSYGHDQSGQLAVRVDVSGLTPGSAHTVEIDTPGAPTPRIRFGENVVADNTGQAHTTVTSGFSAALPSGARFVIRLGLHGGDQNINALAAEPIARSDDLSAQPAGATHQLSGISVDPNGNSTGVLAGTAMFAYNPAPHTITVTVNATGLTPGQHAAHIHTGSCVNQGPPVHMLDDLTADDHGNIVNETRIVTGITNPRPATDWYLNIHQGSSNDILINGQPALSFRPLLCANIGMNTVAGSGMGS